MKRELTGSEAIYGFCTWLTTRKEVTKMSSKHNCAIIDNLIKEFCAVNELSEPADDWHKLFTYPK